MKRAALLCLMLSIGLLGTEAEAARRSTKTMKHPHVSLARRAVMRASRWVGLPSLKAVSEDMHDDCSGLVQLAYWRRDVSLLPEDLAPGESGVSAIYRRAQVLGALHEQPRPGDLVFFRETYDRNHDGKRNDGLTHIGMVERVGRDGTVTFVHRAGGGVKRSKLNLNEPTVRRDARGRVLNDYLRRPDKISDIRLAGELVVGFASVDERWTAPPVVKRLHLKRATARR